MSFGGNTLTKALEWNLRFCLLGFLFDERGQVRKEFVRERRRKDLVEGSVHAVMIKTNANQRGCRKLTRGTDLGRASSLWACSMRSLRRSLWCIS